MIGSVRFGLVEENEKVETRPKATTIDNLMVANLNHTDLLVEHMRETQREREKDIDKISNDYSMNGFKITT